MASDDTSRTERFMRAVKFNPTAWLAFQLVEFIVMIRVLALVLPGDPATYPTWVKALVLVGVFAGLFALNYALRRRFSRGSTDAPEAQGR